MRQQFAILGIGSFGYYLGTHLYKMGHEVIAIDKNKALVQKIKDSVNQAVVADVTDRDVLEALGVKDVDVAIVCIGTRMDASILATLHLRDMQVKKILAKVVTEEHGRILKKIGATEIFFPEKDEAINLAVRLNNPNIVDYLPFIEGYSIVELSPPKDFLGKTLKDLDLINRYGIQVLAVKKASPSDIAFIPTGNFEVSSNVTLIVFGPEKRLKELEEKGK